MMALPVERAVAQPADPAAAETVSWTAAVGAPSSVKSEQQSDRDLAGQDCGRLACLCTEPASEWPHTARITIDANKIAAASGAAVGSPATKVHDAAFNLDTPLYSKAFTAAVPVRVAAHAASGAQKIPVSVRFQTCNGAICQPPKTVHLLRRDHITQ